MNNPLRTLEDYELFLYTLNDPALQSTHPHHKHIPPNIKHNRIPASEMSFTQPNLPVLIWEIETIIRKVENEAKLK